MAFDKTQPLPYAVVNRVINGTVFDGRFKLAPVYLDIEGDLEADIAAGLGVPAEDCASAIARSVAATLKWSQYDPFVWHMGELRAWNELDRPEPPPFTALLAALALAAERMRADDDYSAHNYYERLFEVLGVDSEGRKHALRNNAKSVLPFWHALNRWLAENDFDYGRPTAQQINQWPYAGYALSQALVREADRRRLHGLFAEYGLAPKEILTPAEMSLYLHEWMGGAGPSAWLKKVWASPDLRPRVSAAACSELEAWEGSTEITGQVRRRLNWAASLQTFPKPRLRLFLSASDDHGASEVYPRLQLSGTVSAAAAAAFEACPEGVHLTPAPGGGIAVIEPVADLALSPLMLASFELEDDKSGLRFQRVARAIVPLVKLDTGPFYREVSRISFLRPHMVLCHAQWRARVERLLELNARRGFKVLGPDELPGLAEDWVLFTGVELLRLTSATDANMQALVPLSEGVSVEAAGGLRLAGGLWHSKAPPEITVSGQISPLVLLLKDANGASAAQNTAKATSCRLTLNPGHDLDARDLTLEVYEGERLRRETGFSFRSAAQPRRLAADTLPAYRLSDGDPSGLISAAAADGAAEDRLRGLAISDPEGLRAGSLAGAHSAADLPSADDEIPADLEQHYQLHAVNGLEETCVLRGFHVWECEPFRDGDDPRADKWMTCKACANRVLTRNRGMAGRRTRGTSRGPAAPSSKPPGMQPRQSGSISPDTVFDALCYLGQGSWRKFQDLAAAGDQGELAVQRAAQDLFALGHLDLVYDHRLRSPVAWSVTPPVVCAVAEGLFAAGFRNELLISQLEERLGGQADNLEVTPLENAPSRLFWRGVKPDEAAAALEGLTDRHGRPVNVVLSPGSAIAALAPGVRLLESGLSPIRLEAPKDLQRFDPGSGVWRKADSPQEPGAYRGGYAGRRYFYTRADGSQAEAPYPVVKILAARTAGLRLHSHDPQRSEFYAVLGCEPPGLFHRALAAYSGLPPAKASGRLVYSGVPQAAADLILSKLYG